VLCCRVGEESCRPWGGVGHGNEVGTPADLADNSGGLTEVTEMSCSTPAVPREGGRGEESSGLGWWSGWLSHGGRAKWTGLGMEFGLG